MPSLRLASTFLAFSFACTAVSQTCQSFGDDFVDGGSYFQNSLSTDPFTATQEFEGCQNDTASNLIVDPNGDQTQCTNTPLLPDDTPQVITCSQWPKNQLYSGDWSLLIISNNGDGDPIAYERDFSLSVGPQQTATYTPTVTVLTSTTPIVTQTTTTTDVLTTTLPPKTTTVAKVNFNPTVTIVPLPVITKVTKAVLTFSSTSSISHYISTTTTVSVSCVVSSKRAADATAKIQPTILGALDSVVASIIGNVKPRATAAPASAKFKRAILEGRAVDEEIKRAFVAERHVRLAAEIRKRHPDQPTVTVTDSVASTFPTTTSVSTAPASTVILTTTAFSTSTVTPAPVTVSSGVKVTVATVTATQSTLTDTIWIPATTIVVKTVTVQSTTIATVKTTPAGAAAACSASGGVLS